MKSIYSPFILLFILAFASCDLILSGSYPHAQQLEIDATNYSSCIIFSAYIYLPTFRYCIHFYI